jgi:hypothetical protein
MVICRQRAFPLAPGSVESKIKQIAHRLKITGASWESGNVPQVLRHRCAHRKWLPFLTFLLISLSISTYCKGEMLPTEINNE